MCAKKIIWLLSCAVVLAISADAGDIILLRSTDEQGNSAIYLASESALMSGPTWDGASDPPLSLKDVVVLVTRSLAHKHPQQPYIRIRSISLTQIMERGIKNRWFYTIHYLLSEEGSKCPRTGMYVVLLNGTFVDPVRKIDSQTTGADDMTR